MVSLTGNISYDGSKLSGLEGAEGEAIRELADSYMMLLKRLRYSSENLDGTNFNESADFSNIAAPIMAYIEGESGLSTRLAVTEAGLTSVVSTVAGQQSTISQTESSVSTIVSNIGSDGTVTAASIVAKVNSAGRSVVIDADHIDISGCLTASDVGDSGTTTISGSRITTGTISADRIDTESLRIGLNDDAQATGNYLLMEPDSGDNPDLALHRYTYNGAGSSTDIICMSVSQSSNAGWVDIALGNHSLNVGLLGSVKHYVSNGQYHLWIGSDDTGSRCGIDFNLTLSEYSFVGTEI